MAGRRVAAALAGLVLLLVSAPARGAGAAAGAAAAKAKPGMVVPGVRFEPLDPAGAPLQAEGVGGYRGALEVRPDGSVVNDVALDDYLKGVSEVPGTWPAAALQAQAIAARTYALHELRTKPTICPTQDCQVYAGLAKEQRPDSAGWLAAVDATRGQVLLYRGAPILAKYSSTNGGQTVAGGQPYLRSVPDPDDAASPYHHWRYAVPLAQVGAAFDVPGALFDAGLVGGNVVLTAHLPDGTQWQQPVPAAAFRDRMNARVPAPAGLPLTIPSSRFTVSTNGDGVVVDGRGWGHGIGMSQYGALGKASRGWSAVQILGAYYAGLRPAVVPANRLPATVHVAVAGGRSSTAISTATGSGRFRVLDGNGRVLAPLASGRWQAFPSTRGTVRVLPPTDQQVPLSLAPVGLRAGGLAVRLSAPAIVTVSLARAGQPPAPLAAPAVAEAGEAVVALPGDVAAQPGAQLTVVADAGVGRTVSVPFTVPDRSPPRSTTTTGPSARRGPHVAAASAAGPTVRPSIERRRSLALEIVVAMAALAAVLAALVPTVRRMAASRRDDP